MNDLTTIINICYEWIQSNKTWLFSGIGIFIISILIKRNSNDSNEKEILKIKENDYSSNSGQITINNNINNITNKIEKKEEKYKNLILDEETLKLSFLDSYNKFKINAFIDEDPLCGLYTTQIHNYDDFKHETEELINKAITLKTSKIYLTINEFNNKLLEYNDYLSRIMEVNSSQITRIIKNDYYRNNQKKINKEIREYRKQLLILFNQL